MFPLLSHPARGQHKVTGSPVKLSENPGMPGLPAPFLGQHTRDALEEVLGLNPEEVRNLVERGVIFVSEGGLHA